MDIEGDNMSKKIRIILTILMSIVLIFELPIYSNAWSLDDLIKAGDSFLNIGGGDQTVTMTTNEEKLQNLSNSISGVLLTIAVAVSIISIAVMGINFAVQSVEDKAKIKESMVPWIIGIFVSFGAYGIWKITMGIFYKII